MNKLFKVLVIGIFTFSAVQCSKETPVVATTSDTQQDIEKQKRDSILQDSIKRAQERIRFSTLTFPANKKDSVMNAFLKQYPEDERYIILALNRLDNKNRWRADTLVIPEKIENDFLQYSPFPKRLEQLESVKKMVFFSYTIHAFAVYENGNLLKWGPSSLGKKSTPTKTGLMFSNWKKEVAISTSNSEWILRWNFNIHNTLGIGWHQYDLPGFHASHSCLRLLEEDAKWLYNWADTWVLTNNGQTERAKGTPVIVFGQTDFKTKPWLKLAEDPAANDISIEELQGIFVPHLDKILKEQENSERIRGQAYLSLRKSNNGKRAA